MRQSREMRMNPPEEVVIPITWHSRDQEQIYQSKARFNVVRAGRRWGKTKGAMHRMIQYVWEEPGTPQLWVDTTQANIDLYFNEHIAPILPAPTYHWDKQKKMLTLRNKSTVRFGSVERPENLEGFGYRRIWCNEAGLIFKGTSGERLWSNTLRPMTIEGEGAQCWFVGTPKGVGIYREFSENARKGKEGWAEFHRTSYDNPLIKDSEIDLLVADLPPSVVRQEIFADFVEDDSTEPVVPYQVAREARDRILPVDKHYRPIWGVDVAQFGDDESALCKRRFTNLMEPCRTWRQMDSTQLSDAIKEEFEKTDAEDRPGEILIDEIGYGAGVLDQTRRLGLPVRGVNFSSASTDPQKYFRLRDSLWFKAYTWLKTGSIAKDPELMRELVKPAWDKEHLEKHGKFKVESKDKMRSRLGASGKSPNRADAFVLTMAAGIERLAERKGYKPVSKVTAGATWMSA